VRFTKAVVALLLLAGCGSGPGINTVAKLADALKREGLSWETMGELDRDRALPKRAIQEGFELAGDGLLVEVYRVEDETFFKTVAAALAMRAGLEPEESENALVDVCVHRPFALAVVEEPENHAVRHALARVFPDD
jgi:hypothetical protein